MPIPASLPDHLVRPEVLRVGAYQPGRPIESVQDELGLTDVIKLASNEAPLPPFPAAQAAIAAAAAAGRLYPDSGAWAVRDALAGRLDVPPDWIMVGSGIDGLITCLCVTCLGPGDALAMAWPSFISWRQRALIQGARVDTVDLAGDGRYDLDALAAAIRPETKFAVVVSPNNPTGGAVAAADLERFLDALPDHVLTLLDEAYFEYLDGAGHDGVALVRSGRRLGVLRTFSKAFALAGLRIGYLVAPPELIAELGRVRQAFDVTAPAQAAAVASLAEAGEHLAPRVALNAAERVSLAVGLRALGLQPFPSSANFLLVDLGSAERASAIAAAMLRAGVIVRAAGPFGAPTAVRITVGLPEQNARMLGALRAALAD